MPDVIHKFQKSVNEFVQISLSEFNKRKYVDIRIFFENENEELLPTKKGVTFSVQNFYELKEGIEKMEDLLIKEGLVEEKK